MLKHLFDTTEFNIISARVKSNLHPLADTPPSRPARAFSIPASFFLNSAIIEGGGQGGFNGPFGIDGFRALQNDDAFQIQPDEYITLVSDFNLQIDDTPGDGDFAWLVPEAGDLDNHMMDKLMRERIVPAQYVAAVMAIDIRTPLLSGDRAALMAFVPDRFDVSTPDDDDTLSMSWFDSHDLTTRTIDALRSADLGADPAARDFLDILTSSSGRTPRQELASRVREYQTTVSEQLSGPGRSAELQRLFALAIERRQAIQDHPVLGHLDETGGKLLFPTPGG